MVCDSSTKSCVAKSYIWVNLCLLLLQVLVLPPLFSVYSEVTLLHRILPRMLLPACVKSLSKIKRIFTYNPCSYCTFLNFKLWFLFAKYSVFLFPSIEKELEEKEMGNVRALSSQSVWYLFWKFSCGFPGTGLFLMVRRYKPFPVDETFGLVSSEKSTFTVLVLTPLPLGFELLGLVQAHLFRGWGLKGG